MYRDIFIDFSFIHAFLFVEDILDHSRLPYAFCVKLSPLHLFIYLSVYLSVCKASAIAPAPPVVTVAAVNLGVSGPPC